MAEELEVAELLRAALLERDAMVDFEPAGGSADARAVACALVKGGKMFKSKHTYLMQIDAQVRYR